MSADVQLMTIREHFALVSMFCEKLGVEPRKAQGNLKEKRGCQCLASGFFVPHALVWISLSWLGDTLIPKAHQIA